MLPHISPREDEEEDIPCSPVFKDTPIPTPPPHIYRTRGRSVHIFAASNRSTSIGGLILAPGVTNADFYAMIEILVVFDSGGEYILRGENDVIIEKDNSPLLPGNYYIDASRPFTVNDETVLVRTIISSSRLESREPVLRDAVRARDNRCIITGTEALDAEDDDWLTFEVTPIFPPAYREQWGKWSRSAFAGAAPPHITSVQNGILLQTYIHDMFASHKISINPDAVHKVVHFGSNFWEVAGKQLDQKFVDDPQRPPDVLLRWHFRQAVLANIRGIGEPRFEHDFPYGSGVMEEILQGPKPAERMEFELFSRLSEVEAEGEGEDEAEAEADGKADGKAYLN